MLKFNILGDRADQNQGGTTSETLLPIEEND